MRHHAVLISVASVGVHLIALVAITSISIARDDNDDHEDELPLLVPTGIELVTPAIDVQLIPLPASNDTELASAPASASVRTQLAMSSSRSARARPGEAGGDEPGFERPPSGLFQMRGLRHDLSLPEGVLDRISIAPPMPPEIPTPHDERMKPKGGGNYQINDRVAKMTIDKDGSAHFKNKPDISIGLGKPLRFLRKLSVKKMAKELGDSIEDWYEDPYAQTHAGPTSGMSNLANAIPGGCAAWDAPGCDSDRAPSKKHDGDDDDDDDDSGGGLLGGKLAIDDYLHRKFVGDPYASRKLKLLDSTRDERAKIGAAHRAEQLYRSGELVTRNLQAAWRSTTDPVARKAALFALWDDCSEEGETAQGEAGATARGVVLGWINAKLPKGAPGAFTDTEIAAFDAKRTSKQHFAPYSN